MEEVLFFGLLLLGLVIAALGLWIWMRPSESLRVFLHIVLWMLVRVKVRGEKLPESGGALVAANHYSFLDAFLMGSVTKRWIRYLLWKPYYENKTFQPFAKALYCLPMAQEGIREIISNLKGARAVIEQGEMVGIFPEGEITRNGAMAPFRRGYERILQGTGAPIIPMHLSGLWRHPLSPSPEPWLPWRRWDVTISIGEAMPAETTPEELQQRVLELIGETVGERFLRVARREWRRSAIADGTGRRMSYREWATDAMLLAAYLGEAPKVGILLPASVDGAVANMAVFLKGKIAVNLDWTAGEEVLRNTVERYGIDTVLTSRSFGRGAALPALRGLLYIEDVLAVVNRLTRRFMAFRARRSYEVPGDPGQAAAICGSTGALLTHRELLANVEGLAHVFPADRDEDCVLSAYPLWAPLGLTAGLLYPMAMGLRSVFQSEAVAPARTSDLLERHKGTVVLLTSAAAAECARMGTAAPFARLRHAITERTEQTDEVAAAFFARFGTVLSAAFGGPENGSPAIVFAPRGKVLPGVLARVVDPQTRQAQRNGDAGMLQIRVAGRTALYGETGQWARFDEDGQILLVNGTPKGTRGTLAYGATQTTE